jgi:hypothetical protein
MLLSVDDQPCVIRGDANASIRSTSSTMAMLANVALKIIGLAVYRIKTSQLKSSLCQRKTGKDG